MNEQPSRVCERRVLHKELGLRKYKLEFRGLWTCTNGPLLDWGLFTLSVLSPHMLLISSLPGLCRVFYLFKSSDCS